MCTFLISTGRSPGKAISDLGPRQAADLLAAIKTVTAQPDINPNRVGLFGTSVGGYAALVAGGAESQSEGAGGRYDLHDSGKDV